MYAVKLVVTNNKLSIKPGTGPEINVFFYFIEIYQNLMPISSMSSVCL